MRSGNTIIPNNLRRYRLEAGLKQRDVALLLGIKSVGRISEWESGQARPGVEHLLSLGFLYNRLPDELYYQLRTELWKKVEQRKALLSGKKEKLDSS